MSFWVLVHGPWCSCHTGVILYRRLTSSLPTLVYTTLAMDEWGLGTCLGCARLKYHTPCTTTPIPNSEIVLMLVIISTSSNTTSSDAVNRRGH